MAAQAGHADAVDGGGADGGGGGKETGGQLAVIENNFFQVGEAIGNNLLSAESADETCDSTSYARNLF